MRLQKFMAEAGVASRRKCEELIGAGLVKVNGQVASIGTVIDPLNDSVEYAGKLLRPAEERVVWLGLLRRRLTARSSTGTPIREAIPSAI